jgi:hypothetical protein
VPDTEVHDELETWTGPHEDEVRTLFTELRAQFTTRNDSYAKSRTLVLGDHWAGVGLEPPEERYSLTANYLKTIVDKEVQLMMGTLPGIMVPPPSADQPGRSMAERIENLLYGSWARNDAHMQFLNAAWHSVVLRRGLLYLWWDSVENHVAFKSVVPDNFYPVYDGDELYECIYVSRRLTRKLKRQYPDMAADIMSDEGMDVVKDPIWGTSGVSMGVTDAMGETYGTMYDEPREGMTGYTTVLDYYDREGAWVRIMGNAVYRQNLDYPFRDVPFIEIQNSINGDEREPSNSIDHVAELNQYYNQLLSQKADHIATYIDPPIIDAGSGVDPAKLKASLKGAGVIPVRVGAKVSPFTWEGNMPDIEGQLLEIKDTIFDLSGKPRSSYGQAITNQSGVVTNLTLTPTLQSNELRQTVWGFAFNRLNANVLALYEHFSPSMPIQFSGLRRTRKGASFKVSPFKVSITGAEIAGWYESIMKWPSAIRNDDPVYVQTQLSMVTSDPQTMSVYDFEEAVGVEDVEAWIDRIRAEKEDFRLHPEVLEATLNSLGAMTGMASPDAAGVGAGVGGTAQSDEMQSAKVATGRTPTGG